MHLWPKLGDIPLIGFWDMVLTRFSGRTRVMHPLTDGQTRIQIASRARHRWFNDDRDIINVEIIVRASELRG